MGESQMDALKREWIWKNEVVESFKSEEKDCEIVITKDKNGRLNVLRFFNAFGQANVSVDVQGSAEEVVIKMLKDKYGVA